jgi:hypothetical protein
MPFVTPGLKKSNEPNFVEFGMAWFAAQTWALPPPFAKDRHSSFALKASHTRFLASVKSAAS